MSVILGLSILSPQVPMGSGYVFCLFLSHVAVVFVVFLYGSLHERPDQFLLRYQWVGDFLTH